MAENREEDTLPKCSTLFLTEDGSPMLFYIRPSAMKARLWPLIHHGGGELSSKVLTEYIKLADPGGGGNLSGYLSTDYIFDSIKHNKLQDVEKYQLKSSGDSIKHFKSQEKPSPSTVKISTCSSGKGRLKYTNEEDLALIQFVKQHKDFHSINGNKLYMKAAKAKITHHTWQSMRGHYLHFLCKKAPDCEKLMFKARSKKMPVVVKENTSNCESGQARKTRVHTASPRKKIDGIKKDSSPSDKEQNTVTGQARKTRVHTASPRKKIDGIKKDSSPSDKEQNTVTDNLPDNSSADNVADVAADENMDYDKMFDDNLLRLAHKSKVEKDCNEIDSVETEDSDINEENKVSLSHMPAKRVITRIMQKRMNEQEKLSDFDGKVSFKEDLKKLSTDDEEDKRPIGKKSKKDLPNRKEAQVKESFSHLQALQSRIQKLESQWTVPQIIHALLVNSGMLDKAENYLLHGTASKEQWNSKEDKILLSKDTEAILSLARTRGVHSVEDRMNFMEGIN